MKAQTGKFRSTSFFNETVRATARELIAVATTLGAEYGSENSGEEKTNYDFDFETEEGLYIAVYDWKEYRPIGMDEAVEWHIGGENSTATHDGKRELLAMLTELREATPAPTER